MELIASIWNIVCTLWFMFLSLYCIWNGFEFKSGHVSFELYSLKRLFVKEKVGKYTAHIDNENVAGVKPEDIFKGEV